MLSGLLSRAAVPGEVATEISLPRSAKCVDCTRNEQPDDQTTNQFELHDSEENLELFQNAHLNPLSLVQNKLREENYCH